MFGVVSDELSDLRKNALDRLGAAWQWLELSVPRDEDGSSCCDAPNRSVSLFLKLPCLHSQQHLLPL